MSIPIYSFSMTERHMNLMFEFRHCYRNIELGNELDYHSAGGTALVYKGVKTDFSTLALFDARNYSAFPSYNYNTIEPDFMLFRQNKYIKNINKTRVLGQPDLLVEIWSDSNTGADLDFKQYLYSTSPITEHWYLTQDSNDVVCYLGTELLHKQNLSNVLITRNKIEFDLRRLAL